MASSALRRATWSAGTSLQRLDRGRWLFLAHVDAVRPARRRGRAAAPAGRQRHVRPAPPGGPCGPFADHARAQPLHLDLGGASGRRVAHRSNRRRETVCPSGGAEDAVGLARTSRSTCGAAARCSTNRSRKSASRSITHTTRVSDNCSAACAQSRSPSIQRNDLRFSRGFGGGSPSASGFGGAGASKAARSTPNATPSGLTARVVCNSRPRATAPVWFEPMAAQPLRLPAPGEVQPGAVLDAQPPSRAPASGAGLLAMRREDVADRHRTVGGRWPDQPVMALDQSAGAVGGAGDGAHRRLCRLRALHQPRAQTRVAQTRPAELMLRPDRGVETVANRQRRHDRCRRREAGAPTPALKAYIYHRLARVPAPRAGDPGDRDRRSHPPEPSSPRARSPPSVRSRRRTSPAARGDTHTHARSRRRPNERPGHVRGQVATHDAGTHQQPAQPQHPVQVRAPARIVPPHPGVAGPQPPRTRREPDAAQPAMRRTHQIPQLRADERTGPARVLVGHQRVPDLALSRVGFHRSRVRPTTAPTVPGTSTAGAIGCGSTRARPPPPRAPRPAGSETWPAACRSDNARQQLARCHRPRPSRKSNASQTRSATWRLPTPCDTAPSSTSRRRAGPRLRPDSESPSATVAKWRQEVQKIMGHGQR